VIRNQDTRHRLEDHWLRIITGVGILLGLVLVLEGLLIVRYGYPTIDGHNIGVATSLPFIAWLVVGAYWLSASDIPQTRYDRIGLWFLAGLVGFTLFITLITIDIEAVGVVGLMSTIRWSASVGGGIGLLIGLFDARSIHKAYEAGQARQRQEEIARERDRLDEFASVIAHDLRNPLNVAEGRLELAREEYDSEHLDQIDTALDRMNRIIEDVLWLAREGRDIGSTDRVELQAAVESAWNIVADSTDRADLRYANNENQLPSVRADYDRLCQLLENLLRNAVEHGGDDVTITVGALDGGFYLEDDGPGILKKERDNVFEAGYSTSGGGTGFGLRIVEQVADAHGWEIRVTEGSDGGARFEVTDIEFLAE